jgi:hypothetical protein
MNEPEKGSVDRLSEKLYSRTRYHDPAGKRSPVRDTETSEVSGKWSSPELNELLTQERQTPEVTPFMKKFFLFAMCFFGATIFIAGFIFLGGSNFVSSKNVDLVVVGPTSVSAGEPIELGVTIENHNNTDLEMVKFSTQYPAGARDPEDIAKSLTFNKVDVGEISAGDEAVQNVSMVLIGTTGEIKQIKFSVEYKIKGSNATFYKDKIYDITIGNAPMSISIESPPTVTSGDTFTTKVVISLSSTEILKNVMLRAEYPYGYSVVSTSPEAVSENNVWALGDFSPGTEKTIEIRGRLVGENQDERTLRFYAGVSDNGSMSADFKSVIVSSQQTISIERPSLGLSVSFNGEATPIYVAPAGRGVSTTIRFQNNLPERIINPRLEVSISGGALDKQSIQVYGDGSYNSGSNRVTWDLTNLTGEPELLPGEGGSVSLSFASFAEEILPAGNRDIILELRLTGTPAGSGNKPVTVSESRTVRIASQVTLNSKSFYSIGPFKNSGPIPPKVGSDTTYTIVWTLGNTQGDIADAKVTARLGTGVKWLGAHTASDGLSYNEETNTITWSLDNLTSGSGFSSSGREAAFQIALTPTLGQAGTAPVLVSGITFSGRDASSGNAVTVSNSPVTTRLTNDPAFIQGDDIVVR